MAVCGVVPVAAIVHLSALYRDQYCSVDVLGGRCLVEERYIYFCDIIAEERCRFAFRSAVGTCSLR